MTAQESADTIYDFLKGTDLQIDHLDLQRAMGGGHMSISFDALLEIVEAKRDSIISAMVDE